MKTLELVETLETLLLEERRAVAAFDGPTLERIAGSKLELAQRLGSELKGVRSSQLASELRRVLVEADINRILLDEACLTVSSALGLSAREGTYNARAKVRRTPPALACVDV